MRINVTANEEGESVERVWLHRKRTLENRGIEMQLEGRYFVLQGNWFPLLLGELVLCVLAKFRGCFRPLDDRIATSSNQVGQSLTYLGEEVISGM